jgi:hypothetical protein
MSPHDTANFWPVFLLLGVPLIILTGGPFGWRALVLLGALAALASHPLVSFAIVGLCLIRAPLRWAAEGLIIGFTGGIGARLSGVFSSPERAERLRERWQTRRGRGRSRERGAPRTRGRRPREYFPFDDGVDHLGE